MLAGMVTVVGVVVCRLGREWKQICRPSQMWKALLRYGNINITDSCNTVMHAIFAGGIA